MRGGGKESVDREAFQRGKWGACEPWNQETRELNNFESWLVLLFPNPGATDQESADS